MNENLNNALAAILTTAQESVEKATSFLSAQIPDVVHQLLLWKFTESLIVFSLYFLWILFIFGIVAFVIYRIFKLNWKSEEKSITSCLIVLLGILLSFPALCNIQLVWLQIWIAPKVYLIEYTASLLHK